MCFDWAKGKNQPRALVVPKKDGQSETRSYYSRVPVAAGNA